MKKIALILMPGVERVGAHVGAQNGWLEQSELGVLPRPYIIIGCSGGAVAGGTCLPWTPEHLKKVSYIYKNLKSKQVSSLPFMTEALALLTLGAAFFPIFDIKSASKKKKTLFKAGEVLVSIAIGSSFVYRFFTREAIFSNKPLFELLLHSQDFDGFFNSDIKFEAIATDMNSGEEVVFTNYKEKDRSAPNRNERLVKALLGTSSVTGRLPPSIIDGRVVGDGGILSYIPIHRALAHRCEAIVVLAYNDSLGRQPSSISWPNQIIRSAEITEDEVTKLTLENYNLSRQLDPTLPELFILRSTEILPPVTFRNFDSYNMPEVMNIGYRTVQDNLPELIRVCS